MSLKCLEDNDHDKCSLHFLNYRNCRDFWVSFAFSFCCCIVAIVMIN